MEKIQYPKGCTLLEHPRKPRTAIYISNSLNFSNIQSLTNQFATVIAGKINTQRVLIASIYLHQKQEVTPVCVFFFN